MSRHAGSQPVSPLSDASVGSEGQDFQCGPGARICGAQATCETPPSSHSELSADCNLRTVAIVGAHPIFRDGVAKALMEASCFDVIAQGASKADAAAIVEKHFPDLLILDVNIPGGGIEAAIEILAVYPTMRILFLTASDAEADVLACLQTGALGYA